MIQVLSHYFATLVFSLVCQLQHIKLSQHSSYVNSGSTTWEGTCLPSADSRTAKKILQRSDLSEWLVMSSVPEGMRRTAAVAIGWDTCPSQMFEDPVPSGATEGTGLTTSSKVPLLFCITEMTSPFSRNIKAVKPHSTSSKQACWKM